MTLPAADVTPVVCCTALATPPGLVVTTIYWVPVPPGAAARGTAVMILVGSAPATLGLGEAITIVCFPEPPAANCGTVPGFAMLSMPDGRLLIIVAPLGNAMFD